MNSTRRLLMVPALAAGLLAAAPGHAATSAAAPRDVRVLVDGSGGLTLTIPKIATVSETTVKIDLRDQPAAYVQLVPRNCRFPEPDNWCPIASALAIAASKFGERNSSVHFDNNPDNLKPGPLDVYVLAPGPVTVDLSFGGLPEGRATVRPDRVIDGELRELPRECPEQFGDCRTFASGSAVATVGKRGSTHVYTYSRVTDRGDPTGETPNFASTKSNIACVYSEDRTGASMRPEDHDGSCNNMPRQGDDSWRSNTVNYVAAAQPASGPLVGFSAYGSSMTGRVYQGYRGHALEANEAVAPGRAVTGAWAAWLKAGFGGARA